MTEPADVTATDSAPAADPVTSSDPAPEDGTLVLTPGGPVVLPPDTPAPPENPEPDPEPTPDLLASIGVLSGDSLAAHLGHEGLEAHAAARIAGGGPEDGTTAPEGAVQADPRRTELFAWLEKPVYHEAFHVGDVKYSTCGLCSTLVGPDHDWHTDTHRRTGE